MTILEKNALNTFNLVRIWMLQNQLVINEEKCKCVFFRSSRIRNHIEQIVVGNKALRTQ